MELEFIHIATAAGLCILSYLCGSIMFAMVVTRILHLSDPREAGSKNPGATNMLRLHGRTAAILTITGDMGKGAVPVVAARFMEMPETVIMLCVLAVFCGHVFPLFHRFRGGKGVATFFGALWALNWQLGLVFTATWLFTAMLWRYSSLASIIATMAAMVAALTTTPYSLIALAPVTIITVWRHKQNIYLLIAGKEKRIGGRSSADS